MNEAAKVVQHDRRHLSLLASSGSFRASQARALRQGGHRSQRIMKAIDGNGPQGRTVQGPPPPIGRAMVRKADETGIAALWLRDVPLDQSSISATPGSTLPGMRTGAGPRALI